MTTTSSPTPIPTPILRSAEDYARELQKVAARVKRRDDAQERDRAYRNRLIYEGCEAGLTERAAAEAAGVSYGYAGQAHRGEGDPAKGKRR